MDQFSKFLGAFGDRTFQKLLTYGDSVVSVGVAKIEAKKLMKNIGKIDSCVRSLNPTQLCRI